MKKITSKKQLLRIMSYMSSYRWQLVAGLICTFLFGAIEAVIPWLMYLLFEPQKIVSFVDADDIYLVLPTLLVFVFFTRSVLGFGRIYFRDWMNLSMTRDVRRQLFRKMTNLPKSYYDSEGSGVLIAKIMQFVDQMFLHSTEIFVVLAQDSARLFGFLLTMSIISWRYTLIMIMILPVTLLVITFFTKRIRRFASGQANAITALTGSVSDTLQGQVVVKAYGGQSRELKKLDSLQSRVRGQGLRQAVVSGFNVPLSQLVIAMSLAVIFALLARDLANGDMSVGHVSAFIFSMLLIPLPLRNIANLAGQIQISLAASDQVFGVLDSESEQDTGTFAPEKVKGEIEFNDIKFSYPASNDASTIDGFDLSIKAGETIALVGSSGSGKSSVVSLILGLYRPQQGSIAIDGEDISKWSLEALRSNISVVTQEVILFNTSVAENVAYPLTEDQIDQPRLEQALKDAQIYEVVKNLPEGLDTKLGERSLRLSGGERQRIALARAYYHDAPIVVMDEATSSVDSKTEEAINTSLKNFLAKKTAIVIVHQFAIVDIADRVVVMEKGKITAQGTHQELMASSQLYKALYDAQSLTNQD